jgi:16S rRNA (uracil1498-N3)-methyltransferase
MALPFFYTPVYDPAAPELTLDEDNSRHIIQVLRMRPGEDLQLTDGKGVLLTATIVDDHKKKCRVSIRSAEIQPRRSPAVIIAISPLKNASRFEWFLEKATEIGVSAIIPLICERTERQVTRHDRLRHILISAMLQSQQTWLPALPEPQSFSMLVSGAMPAEAVPTAEFRLIAHCLEAPRATMDLTDVARGAATTTGTLILIGPEGDFSPREVETALAAGYLPVSLGANRLRTETAGIVAATLLCIK